MAYNNLQISNMWHDAWSKTEEALRFGYVKLLVNLSDKTKSLPSLNCGDHVMIKNQTGPFPNKWGKTGVKRHDVKVDGSGRLTVRNRKFLRKFNPAGCKSLSSILHLRKANIQLQKCVFSGNDEKRYFQENDAVCDPRR